MAEISDPTVEKAREKAKELGINPLRVEVLATCSNLDELNRECAQRKWGAGGIQILTSVFAIFFQRDEKVRKKAEKKLGPLLQDLPLPPPAEFLAWYFSGDHPGLIFALKYGDQISHERRATIDQAAIELMFEIVKENLE